jgi:hypothetical protein
MRSTLKSGLVFAITLRLLQTPRFFHEIFLKAEAAKKFFFVFQRVFMTHVISLSLSRLRSSPSAAEL